VEKRPIITFLLSCLVLASCSSVAQTPVTTATAIEPQPSVSVSAEEQKYLQSAVPINSTLNNGQWQVKVIRAGYFDVSDSSGVNSYLRIDIEITILNTTPDYFIPGLITVSSPQGQCAIYPDKCTLDPKSFDVYPDHPVSGYWLFQGTLNSLDRTLFTFTAGHDACGAVIQWSFPL
jgi:uncharacterized protein YcfL